MNPQPTQRFEVVVEEGSGHGGLYELEQTTYYRVMDTQSQEVLLTFAGTMSASLSRTNGQWDDYNYSGVCAVTIAPDQQSVSIKYYEGREETVPLPK